MLFPNYNPVITSFNIHNNKIYKKNYESDWLLTGPIIALIVMYALVLIYVTETEKTNLSSAIKLN